MMRYYNEIQGFNSRLAKFQVACLPVKLKTLDEWNARRTMIAQYCLETLAKIPSLRLPHVHNWAEPVWHLFVIRSEERDKLAAKLKENGIQTLIHYPIPPHLSQAYQVNHNHRKCILLAERLTSQVLSIPINPCLANLRLELKELINYIKTT